jgi:hypothetical protein
MRNFYREHFTYIDSRHIPAYCISVNEETRKWTQMRPCLVTGKGTNQQLKFTEYL